jgi:DNA mismatch repair protein MutS2
VDPHSFRVLEFPLVLDCLAGETVSALGSGRARALAPSADPDLVRFRLQETREARALLLEGPVSDLSQARDIREALGRAQVRGARLAPQDLTAIADTLEAAEQVRRRLRQPADRPALAAIADRLRPPAALSREIRRAVLPDGSVADTASSDLFHLRAQARRAREAARETAQGLLADTRLAPIIAEPVVTMRNDRYVIPVLPGYRTLLTGVVQDQSATGHTVFLEPLALVEQNNAIRRLEREADAEVDRILGELTDGIRLAAEDIASTVEALADCDLALAKARLAARWAASEPRVAEGGPLALIQARHPLLVESRRQKAPAGAEEVVPIDVPLDGARVLVLTGPNAGGKTVALKTVGLLALMVQAGLQIPAAPDSMLPICDGVFADIGDEQSIAQDLSTFSAHMARITAILRLADRQSLVLIDELGAGTDPGEGAALGNAILETLAGRGAYLLATTHLDGIKAFVAQDPRMVNGAVEFDLDRMRPLYTLHIGFPGRSFAIDMACRLGVPSSIVQRARDLCGDASAGEAALLDRLHALESARLRDAAEAARDRAEAARLRADCEAMARDLADRLAQLRSRAGRIVAEIAGEGRKRIEAAVADLRQGGAARAARLAVGDLAGMAERHLEDVASGAPAVPAEPLAAVAEGQSVRVRNLGQVGTVLSAANPQGLVEVQVPLGKIRVPLGDLSLAQAAAPTRIDRLVTWRAGAGDALSPEIKVIGCTVEEAIPQVSRHLEDAVLGGLTSVRIVHGKGTGRLRRGLTEFLKTHPLVAGFRLADFNEGGAGATIVDLGARRDPTAPAAPTA